MKRSLNLKIALAFVLVAVVTAGLVALFIRLTSADRLTRLIIDQQVSSYGETLSAYYAANGSWKGVEEALIQIRATASPIKGDKDSHTKDRNRTFGLADAHGVVVIPYEPQFSRGEQVSAVELARGTAVMVDGRQVGTILEDIWTPDFNPAEALYLERINRALLLAVAGAAGLALILGTLLARTLTRPLKALTRAAQGITAGQPEQPVDVTSDDEIGQLADAFNRMVEKVERVNLLRRQMTADIAHDLRTPLTVIAGYIESMRDGVLQPTPQRMELVYAEIERLQRLVDDLRMLSQADAGELPIHKQPVAPRALLERAAGVFQLQAEKQAVRLRIAAPDDLPEVEVDDTRMMQVFGNLLSNALRYTLPGGEIVLGAQTAAGAVRLTVQDSGVGIDPDELPLIFDRFHRADKSRNTETGESGLGLAIVKALVEAHGGRIGAESHPGRGTTIMIDLPRA